jgi:hypothetical protein
MSTETTQEEMGPTKPVAEHAWLKQLVGNWKTKSEMFMPDGSKMESEGTETVEDFGGLWAYGSGQGTMPDGDTMGYKVGLGYDVSFKEYRGFMMMSVSSHLWKYTGTLSPDGRTMTLDCEGPDMMNEGKTAQYRDIIEIIDADHRTLTSTGQLPDGSWATFMKASYERA